MASNKQFILLQAFTSSLQPSVSLHLAVIQLHVWKDENYKICNFLLCVWILKCEVAIVLFMEMEKEYTEKPLEHVMGNPQSTCTLGESTHSRVVLMSSVLVLSKLGIEDYFCFYFARPSLLLQRKDRQSNNEFRVATNMPEAAAILFLIQRLVGRFHSP